LGISKHWLEPKIASLGKAQSALTHSANLTSAVNFINVLRAIFVQNFGAKNHKAELN